MGEMFSRVGCVPDCLLLHHGASLSTVTTRVDVAVAPIYSLQGVGYQDHVVILNSVRGTLTSSSFLPSFRLWLRDCDMSPQLPAGSVTLKLGFPGAAHLLKEFFQLERGSPASWDGEGAGLGGDLRLPREGSCFHDVREAEPAAQVQGGCSHWLQLRRSS